MATRGIKPSPTFNKSLLETLAICFELRWVLKEKEEEGFGLEVEEVAEENMEGCSVASEIAIFGVRESLRGGFDFGGRNEVVVVWLLSVNSLWMRFVGIIKVYLFIIYGV